MKRLGAKASVVATICKTCFGIGRKFKLVVEMRVRASVWWNMKELVN